MDENLGTNLFGWVADRLTDEDAQAADLVLAAFDGAEAVRRVLAGSPPPERSTVDESPVERVWLKTLVVEGFRGIGPRTWLNLDPKPGLTVVSGRNGSGKSSLAEGLEVALTGRTHRWGNDKLSTQFDPEWRNLHTTDEPAIALKLSDSDGSELSLHVDWEEGETDKTKSTVTLFRNNQHEDLASLGWANALQVFRPLLSYEELGQSLLKANQRATAQAFERGLGLQQLSAAADALREVTKEAGGAAAVEKAARAELRQALTDSADDRAAALLDRLPKRITTTVDVTPFVDASAATAARQSIRALEDIANVDVPSRGAVGELLDRVRRAADTVAALQQDGRELDRRRHSLLQEALDLHAAGGDCVCPVCGTGSLDQQWRQNTAAALTDSAEQFRASTEATGELQSALRTLRRIVGSAPGSLSQQEIELPGQADAAAAWHDLADLPDDPIAACSHVEQTLPRVIEATQRWRDQADAELATRHAAWAPVAQAVGHWLQTYRDYCRDDEQAKRLAKADALLKQVLADAREHQIGPIRQRAQEMWQMLRHESNVSLGDLKLTSQRLEVPATVDGEKAGALQVMSQGELHALALALFLPRVATDASPFRFVVLDDPVQAMDPAKVEGLLDVLLSLAAIRQVVVFSHDDRLAAAARRRMLTSEVTIKLQSVQRGSRSRVTVKVDGDPAGRYLSEAEALTKDKKVPAAVKARVVGGLFRMAIEAAARDRWQVRAIRDGTGLAEAERCWAERDRTASRVALALGVDKIIDWYDWDHPHRKRAIDAANKGQHEALPVDALAELQQAVAATVRELRPRHD